MAGTERVRLTREEMGPLRKAADTGGKLNTGVDVLVTAGAYVAFGAVAAGLAFAGLLTGMAVREDYIKKGPRKKGTAFSRGIHKLKGDQK